LRIATSRCIVRRRVIVKATAQATYWEREATY
jgi:hypothetical protein